MAATKEPAGPPPPMAAQALGSNYGRRSENGYHLGGMPLRLVIGGIALLGIMLFSSTLPALNYARSNSHTPRPIDWTAVHTGHADLTHNYVRVSGLLTRTVLTRTKNSNVRPYEIVVDPETRTSLLVGHWGSSTPVRTGPPTPATLTGMLEPMDDKLLAKLSPGRTTSLSRTYMLTENRHPGDVGRLTLYLIGEILGLLLLGGIGIRFFLIPLITKEPVPVFALPEKKNKTAPVVADTATDWKKLRLDD